MKTKMTDEQLQEILKEAEERYRKHYYSARGQQITPADDQQAHVAWVAWEMAQKQCV